jgi:hypothetical protein
MTAVVRYDDESKDLERYDIASFNVYAEAGAGLATHARPPGAATT